MNTSVTGIRSILQDPIAKKKRPEKIKCVFVGDGTTGKTSLLTVYAEGEFPEDYLPTVFENYNTTITVDEKSYTLMLWDTGGQEDFERLRTLNYQNSDVIVVCYDVARNSSFENVTAQWVPEINNYCPSIPVVLVACKTDLRTKTVPTDGSKSMDTSSSSNCDTRIISTAEGKKLAKTINASAFVECSAKNNHNITMVIDTAIGLVLKLHSTKKSDCCLIF